MHLSRRHALGSAAAALLAACTSRPRPPHPVDPDDALVAAAVLRELALLAGYDAAAAAAPTLRARLAPLRADHLVHLTALGGIEPTPGPAPVAGTRPPAQVLQQLRIQEHTAAVAHAEACVKASRTLAATLASLAACESSHGAVL